MDNFMSVDNMKYLINILNSMLKDKYNFDLINSNLNHKTIFLDVMQKVKNDNSNNDKSIKDLNKLTLKVTREIVKQHFNLEKNNLSNRDNILYGDRPVIVNDNKPSQNNNNNDINKQMENMKNLRINEENLSKPKFEDVHKQDSIISMTEDDFNKSYEQIMLVRNQADETYKNQTGNKLNKFNEHILKPLDHNFNQERQNEIADLINTNILDTNPADFYSSSLLDSSKDANNIEGEVSTFAQIALAGFLGDPSDSNTTSTDIPQVIEEKFILINSFDRNWVVDRSRYSYKVKFNFSTNTPLRVPYYTNNPTIPFTKTEQSSGIANTYGWYDNFGTGYPAYDSNSGLGTIIGYEDIQIVTDQDANLVSTFKDIHSITVTNVTIPTEVNNQYVNSVNLNNTFDYTFNFNFPYVLLNIDEFTNVYDGTDDTIRKAFCQLQYDCFFRTPNGRGYIILKPVQQEKKIFFPTPLTNLTTMNISMTKPNGELLNPTEDGLEIFNIALYQTYYLKITTKEYFEKDAFFKGDFVRIRNFALYKIVSSQNTSDIDSFNTFINREAGHQIYEIGEPNDDGYYNCFHIYAPGAFNKTLGKFDVYTGQTDALGEFNTFLSDQDFYSTYSSTYTNGVVLNMSLQNSISMKIEQFIPDPGLKDNKKIT